TFLYLNMTTLHDVLIIGTGLSALTAASTLKQHQPILLEARNRIGGRAHTSTITEQPVDLGCSMIHGYKEGNPLTQVLQDYSLPPAHVVTGSQPLVITSSGPLSSTSANTLFSTSATLSYSPPHPPPSSSASLASVLLPALSSPELVALARTTEIGAGVKLEELSAKWWGFGRGFGGTDGFPVGGYVSILEALVGEIEEAGGKIELEKEVVSLSDLGAGKGVQVTTRDGTIYRAKTVLSTLPLGVLQARPPSFTPSLPPTLLSAIQRTRVGVLEKAVLSYSSPWWTSPETYGQFLLLPTVSPSEQVEPTSLEQLFNQTTLNVSSFARIGKTPHPTLLVYLGADAGSFVARYPPAEVLSALHSYLSSRIPSTTTTPPPAFLPQKSTLTSWLNDPFSLGATSSPITLATSDDGEQASPLDFLVLGRSVWDGRLGFAGEHTEVDSRGSAAGAVVSGKREGERV
ncbi:hypothetical protein BCR35DRAFT_257423, partial [Leucosporidium creatinivorum]